MGRSKHIAAALIAICLSILSVCSCLAAPIEDDDAAQDVLMTGMSWISFVNSMSDDNLQYMVDNAGSEDLEQYFPGFTNMVGGLQNVISNRADLGDYVGIRTSETSADDDNYYAQLTLQYTNRDVEATIGLDKELSKYTRFSFDPVYTFGEKMRNASMNLVVGMVTVFAVLILLMFIIDSFKYIHAFEEKHKNKSKTVTEAEPQVPPTAAAVSTPAACGASKDDAQLAAVITAAIAAYEGTSADGLVVRSIRRAKDNKWRRS